MLRAALFILLVPPAAPQPNVTTFSGGGPILAGGVDGVGSAALFNAPTGVALSADASLLFVCDRGNHKIRAITLATREVTTLAGGGASGSASGTALANGPGAAALFNAPWNLAFSPAFNLVLVADSGNHAVRAITKNGVVSTLAGGGATGSASGTADGVGTNALLTNPVALAVEPATGVAYLMERARLRGISPNGTTWFIAGGNGAANGVGTNAGFNACSNGPTVCSSMILAPDGDLYMLGAYYGQFRRAVIATGAVTSFYDSGSGNFGQGTGLALAGGAFFIVDSYGYRLLTLPYASLAVNAPNAPFAGVPGSGDGDSWVAGFNLPGGVVATPDDATLYLVDTGNNRVRAVDRAFRFVTTVAGGGNAAAAGTGPGVGDGGPGDALFTGPYGITAVTNTTLLLTESTTHQVRLIDACAGVVSLAGTRPTSYVAGLPTWNSRGFNNAAGGAARFSTPFFSAVLPNGSFVVADSQNYRLRAVTPGGVVTTFAGSGTLGFTNGAAAASQLSVPHGVAVGADGAVFFSETGSHAVRMVTPGGLVAPLAGPSAVASGAVDAVGSNARFNSPRGLAVLPATGAVYVADWNNKKIRVVALDGTVATLCGGGGTGVLSGNANGVGTNALLAGPNALAFLSAALYVADNVNHNIRVVADVTAWPAAVVTTLTGLAGGGFADGTAARFNSPSGLAIAGSTLWVTDNLNNRIRRVELGAPPSCPPPTPSGSKTASVTATRTPTVTRSTTRTASVTASPTATPSAGASPTGTPSDTGSPTGTPSPTRSVTPSGDPTFTGTRTPTVSRTATVTGTASLTPSPFPACAPGTFTNASRACAPCPAGSFCPGTDFWEPTARALPCPAGTAAGAGAAACAPCPPGQSAAAGAAACAVCPAPEAPTLWSVSTWVGAATSGFTDGASPLFDLPTFSSGYLAIDAAGNVLVAQSSMLRRVTPAGVASTLGPFTFSALRAIALDARGLIFTAEYNTNIVRVIAPNGTWITNVAGSGVGGSVDGIGTNSQLCQPKGLSVNKSGSVFVAQYCAPGVLRAMAPGTTAPRVQTAFSPFPAFSWNLQDARVSPYDNTVLVMPRLAGFGGTYLLQHFPHNGSTLPFGPAVFGGPNQIAIDASGVVYAPHTQTGRVLALDRRTLSVATIVGNASSVPAFIDGPGAAAAVSANANGIAVDHATGTLYIGDTHRLRKVSPSCPPGFYGNLSCGFTCVGCPPGEACPLGSREPCANGTFSNATRALQCAPCAPGFFSNAPGATACLPCPPLTTTLAAGAWECTPLAGSPSPAPSASASALGSSSGASFPTGASTGSTSATSGGSGAGTPTGAPTGSASATSSSSGAPPPTGTSTGSASATSSGSSAGTPTGASTGTVSATGSGSGASTATGSASGSASASSTGSDTPSRSPTGSPTRSPTGTLSSSPTGTLSGTPTPTTTASLSTTASTSPTPSLTSGSSASNTGSVSDSPSPTPSTTLSGSATLTGSGTGSATPTGSGSGTRSPTPTASCSSSPSPTPSPQASAPPTPSATGTGSQTESMGASTSATPSAAGTRAATSSATLSPSGSPSGAPSLSATPSPPPTPSASASATASVTPIGSPPPSRSPAAGSSSTPSASPTPTLTAGASTSSSGTETGTGSGTGTLTGSPSGTPPPTPSTTASASSTVSATPTASLTSGASASNTGSNSWSASPTASQTGTGSGTGTPTGSPSGTPPPTPSTTASASSTVSATPTATLPAGITPSGTDSASFSASATPSQTPTSSATPTPSGSGTGTPPPTPSTTLSGSSTATASPTSTLPAGATASPTPTLSESGSATPSQSASGTPTGTPTASPTGTASDTPSPTRTLSASASGTPTPSLTAGASPSNSGSLSLSPSATPSGTGTASPSGTPTASATGTPPPTPTSTASGSPTVTASATPSLAPGASPSATGSDTASGSASPTTTAAATPSPTRTGTPTETATPSKTGTPTATLSSGASPSSTPSVPPSDSGGGSGSSSGSGSVSESPRLTGTASPLPAGLAGASAGSETILALGGGSFFFGALAAATALLAAGAAWWLALRSRAARAAQKRRVAGKARKGRRPIASAVERAAAPQRARQQVAEFKISNPLKRV